MTRSFYHRNALGSVMEITDLIQATAVSYRYDPYGKVTITRGGTPQATDPLGQHWTFAARFLDEESNLLYYRARYYDPAVGRFLQRDPLGYSAGPNLFCYVDSAPINSSDPTGLQELCSQEMPMGMPGSADAEATPLPQEDSEEDEPTPGEDEDGGKDDEDTGKDNEDEGKDDDSGGDDENSTARRAAAAVAAVGHLAGTALASVPAFLFDAPYTTITQIEKKKGNLNVKVTAFPASTWVLKNIGGAAIDYAVYAATGDEEALPDIYGKPKK